MCIQIEKRLEVEEVQEVGEGSQSTNSNPSGCTIFLGYTSNLISSGVRETIRYLAEHSMVHKLHRFNITIDLPWVPRC